jgi:hypothetical protein
VVLVMVDGLESYTLTVSFSSEISIRVSIQQYGLMENGYFEGK